MQAIVNGLLTNYQLEGKGKLVLFLHGWGDSAVSSSQLRENLAKSYKVVALDLPGFGKTQKPDQPWKLENYVGFVAAFLEKLKLTKVNVVIGHSNGGAIAIKAIASGAVTPQYLVLLGAAGIRNSGSARKTGLQIVAKTGKAATIALPARYKQALRRRLYAAADSDLLIVPGMEETFKNTVKQDVQAEAALITVPTLIIYGQNDTATPPWMAERYTKLISGAELHILPDAGHFVHVDAVQQVAQLTRKFIA